MGGPGILNVKFSLTIPHSAIRNWIGVYRTAFEKEKELTDRALKLAEIGKPKSNCEIQGILGLAAFACRIVGRGKGNCCYAANCEYFELRPLLDVRPLLDNLSCGT